MIAIWHNIDVIQLIQEGGCFFCSKLMVVLKSYIESMDATKVDLLCRTMKSLGYIFKFIIRSRFLFAAYVLI